MGSRVSLLPTLLFYIFLLPSFLLGKAGFEPVAQWSGRLIFPPIGQRRADGAVMIELHNWPKEALQYNKSENDPWPSLPLLWPTAPFEPEGIDVCFSDESLKYIGGRTPEEARLLAPWRLSGLKKVRTLEALAGARMVDDVEVRLKDPKVSIIDGFPQLIIDEEPVQVAGTHYCLVRFSGKDDRGRLIGKLWSKEERGFKGTELTFTIPKDIPHVHHKDPLLQVKHTTVERIWHSPLNQYGWYAYVHFDGDECNLDGLVPRRVHELKPDELTTGVKPGRRFIESEQWDCHALDHAQRSYRSMMVSPTEGENVDQVAANFSSDRGPFLVLHIFGSWGRGQVEEQPKLNTGHFAFGLANVVTCPFTGNERFQIEYKQVYGTNDQGIVSGAVDWAEYMGGIYRGWMYLRPTWDILVDFPPLTKDYQYKGKTISPFKILCDELSHVMAAYRVGMGGGCAMVTVLNSCVQDSTQGLFRAMESIFADESEHWAAGHRYDGLFEFRQFAESDCEDEEAARWRKFRSWYDGASGRSKRCLSREFFRVAPAGLPLGRVWRSDWQENLEDRSSFHRAEHRDGLLDVLDAYKASRNSMMPRRAQDTHAKLLLEKGANLWVINTVQTGGIIEGQFARAPEKLNWTKMRKFFGKVIPGWGK